MYLISLFSSSIGIQIRRVRLSNHFGKKSKSTFSLGLIISSLLFSASSYSNQPAQTTNSLLTVRKVADHNESAWKAFNISTVENYIIPAYSALAESNSKLHVTTQTLCKTLASSSTVLVERNLASVKDAFHQSMDAWQYIQNINFGPIEIGMRNHSIQFWPDKKNHIGKQLLKLISDNDPSALTSNEFENASVSVKGLPAIERLLFNDELFGAFKNKSFSCEVLVGISRYLMSTSKSLHEEWELSMLPQFRDAKQLDGYFEDDIDAATSLLKTLVEPIEVIRDLKLQRPLGNQFDKVKFKRFESWRSERSLKNIKLNILSLESLFIGALAKDKGLQLLLTESEYKAIKQDFTKVLNNIQQIESPLKKSALTASGYQSTESLIASLTELHVNLETAITHSGIRLGFNSRDGD